MSLKPVTVLQETAGHLRIRRPDNVSLRTRQVRQAGQKSIHNRPNSLAAESIRCFIEQNGFRRFLADANLGRSDQNEPRDNALHLFHGLFSIFEIIIPEHSTCRQRVWRKPARNKRITLLKGRTATVMERAKLREPARRFSGTIHTRTPKAHRCDNRPKFVGLKKLLPKCAIYATMCHGRATFLR